MAGHEEFWRQYRELESPQLEVIGGTLGVWTLLLHDESGEAERVVLTLDNSLVPRGWTSADSVATYVLQSLAAESVQIIWTVCAPELDDV